VVRGVRLLQALNRQPMSSIDILYKQTGIPKPSLVRLLQTLGSIGLVRHGPQHGTYYLTSEIRTLSSGYHDEPRIVEAAAPVLEELTRRIKWPTALAVYEDNAVVIRYSTIPNSPLSLLHSTINLRHSLVARALGRAYLAFCDEQTRDAIIEALQTSSLPEDLAARDPVTLRRVLDEVRAKGYATRDPLVRPVSGTLAVPIFEHDRVVASVGITYFTSTLTVEQVVTRHLADLLEASAQVSAALTRIDQI